MKILHVIFSLHPSLGGPPSIAARLAAAQAGLGHQVRIVTYRRSEEEGTEVEQTIAGVPHRALVRIEWLAYPHSLLEEYCGWRTLRAIKPMVAAADIVHLHGVWDTILRVTANECRRVGKPYLVLVNGLLDPWSLQQKFLKKKLALRYAYRRLLNNAAALHLGNEDERRLIAPLQLTCPTLLIPNGIFLENLDPAPQRGEFYAQHPELKDRPYILFLSRLNYKKGLDYLADAFAQVAFRRADVQLVVAGPDDGARAPFAQYCQALGMAHRVHLVGPVYGKDKSRALVDAACFCLPSRQEGFSVAITEALAFGVPVVISEPCHFPQVAQAQAGMVTPLDSREIAAGLERILSDGDLRRRMSRAGQKLVRENYTWPKVAQATIAAYERALAH